MRRRSRRLGLLGLAAGVALAGVLAIPAAALAQEPDPGAEQPAEQDNCDRLGNALLNNFCRGTTDPGAGMEEALEEVTSVHGFGGPVAEAISAYFTRWTAEAIPVLTQMTGTYLLVTPDVTSPEPIGRRVRELWGFSAGVANTVVVVLVVVGGVLLMTHETYQTRYQLKDVAPRLVAAVAVSNLSLLAVGWGIQLANALSEALVRFGERVGAEDLRPMLEAATQHPGIIGSQIFGTFVLVVLVLGVLVWASWWLRMAVVILLVAVAPLALVTHALPHTEGVARLWWRALAATLAAQVGQAFVLIGAVYALADPMIGSLLDPESFLAAVANLTVVGVLLWLLALLPFWAYRTAFRNANPGRTLLVAAYATYQLVQLARGRARRGQAGGGRR